MSLTGCLSIGEHAADLRDVSLAASPRVGIESELDRHVGRGQQRELLGFVVLTHAAIVPKGCHRVPLTAVSADGSTTSQELSAG